MKALAIGLAALLAFGSAPVAAKDYGQVGAVFRVIEPDLLRVIEGRLNNMQSTGRIDAMNQEFARKSEAKVRRPTPVPGISGASTPRSWLFDPSIVIDHEIRDNKRNLISAAGRRINPLDYVVVKTPLVFIDGDDADEVSWALKRYSDTAKLILVSGAPLEAMTTHQRRFYFDNFVDLLGPVLERRGIPTAAA